ncbi:MAG: hypothetical protein Q8Q02_07205 [Nocardioides sp.]|nr:hypothetical protein [Nocardioides sp.]
MPPTQLPLWRSVLAVVAHPDDESFALGAILAAFADTLDLAVLGWTVPETVAQRLRAEYAAPFDGYAEHEIDVVVSIERSLQLKAVGCHPSQAVAGSVLWRRIELLEDKEHLRWLRRERVANTEPSETHETNETRHRSRTR